MHVSFATFNVSMWWRCDGDVMFLWGFLRELNRAWELWSGNLGKVIQAHLEKAVQGWQHQASADYSDTCLGQSAWQVSDLDLNRSVCANRLLTPTSRGRFLIVNSPGCNGTPWTPSSTRHTRCIALASVIRWTVKRKGSFLPLYTKASLNGGFIENFMTLNIINFIDMTRKENGRVL